MAIATLFVYAAACGAQADAVVARPDVKVDDRWIYRRMDHRFEPPVLLYELRVTFVDARAIHTVLARQGRPRDSDATWTPEVPAGKFQALKVEAEGRWRRLDTYEDAQGKIGEELVFFVVE